MIIKLIIMICTFFGALLLSYVAMAEGYINNTIVLTLDNGFKIDKAILIAGFISLLTLKLKSE